MPIRYKQYIGISRDHSGSMQSITRAAMKDYNNQIEAISESSESHGIETIVSVVKCGVGFQGRIEREVVNTAVSRLRPITSYIADGGSTPLFNSVKDLIDILKSTPDYSDPDVSFLVIAVTDGYNNSGDVDGGELGRLIKQLQSTDRWTFVFRVPRGAKQYLADLGIPEGNIQEWEQTESGMMASSQSTVTATRNYYAGRSKGIGSSSAFYANLTGSAAAAVKKQLANVSTEVDFYPVRDGGETIREFIEKKTGDYITGAAFYQLNKPEKQVQDYKLLAVVDKYSGNVYVGQDARGLLGLPTQGTIKLEPGNSPSYDIYIQSTSTNRRLIAGTSVLYWPNYQKGRYV